MLWPAYQIVPFDHRVMIELEAPVGDDTVRLQGGAIGGGEVERGPVVDRRQPASGQDLALEIEFLRGLIGWIDPTGRAQFLEAALVQSEPIGLANGAIGDEPEPGEIGMDRIGKGLGRSRQIGIIHPQQEAPAGFLRPQPVMKRCADIADMDTPGGRRGETGYD